MISYTTEETLPAKTAEWLERIKSYNMHSMSLNVGKSALLVIDLQKYFFDSDSSSFTSGDAAVLRNIRNIIDGFRKAGMPVIYTCHVHRADRSDAGIMEWWWDDMCIEGSEDAKIDEKIAPLATEKIIFKHRYSAFYNTDLETILRVMKIEDIVITGVMTNLCCESTARDAYYRDYRVHFLADATGSICEEMHVASLLNLAFGFAHVTTTEKILECLRTPAAVGVPARGTCTDKEMTQC